VAHDRARRLFIGSDARCQEKLGVEVWVPLIAVGAMIGAVAALRRVSQCRRSGLWAGLAIIRNHGRGRMIAFAVLAVCAQVARNWLMLHAIGAYVSALDAMALLIAMFTVGQLPAGPSSGAAASVLILGHHGVAAVAAAGVLLTVTSVIGSLCYAAWAITDRIVTDRLDPSSDAAVAALAATTTSARYGAAARRHPSRRFAAALRCPVALAASLPGMA
jgi:hypothetical protein